jgi:hypothetical protein
MTRKPGFEPYDPDDQGDSGRLAFAVVRRSNDQNLWMRLGEVHESGRTFPRMI